MEVDKIEKEIICVVQRLAAQPDCVRGLRIKTDGNVREAALHDGFVQIQKDKVTVLAESCEWPDEIDEKRAQKARERAERRLQHADDRINIARAELALKKSIIRLGLSQSGRKE